MGFDPSAESAPEGPRSSAPGSGPSPVASYRSLAEGVAHVFVAVDHGNSECVGIHADKSANRFQASEGTKMKESLTLGELEGSLHLLEIRCTKCDRYGRERLTRMIERYGKKARLPDVRHRLAADLSVPEGRRL